MKRLLLLAALVPAMLGAKAQNVARNCYRGFVDLGYSVGYATYNLNRFEVNTSHGYQFTPHIFLGAGLGFHFMQSYETPDMKIPFDVREKKIDIPVFANLRWNFMKRSVTPFMDFKGGTYVTNNGGLYLALAAGCRISVGEKQAVNFSVGYTLDRLEFQTFHHYTNSSFDEIERRPEKCNAEAVTVKLGYEF